MGTGALLSALDWLRFFGPAPHACQSFSCGASSELFTQVRAQCLILFSFGVFFWVRGGVHSTQLRTPGSMRDCHRIPGRRCVLPHR
jgi:hypothetical protein